MARRRHFDVAVDTRNGWLVCDRRRVDIRPAVARLLGALLAARGQTETAETLRKAIRRPGNPEVSQDNLGVTIRDLRKALAKAGARTQVANRIGFGWRLDAGGES